MKFDCIIPIGYFCSVTVELERKGYRNRAFPFDWMITDIDAVTDLILNNFKDLFKEEMLKPDEEHKGLHVKHSYYNLEFFHEFDPGKNIYEQMEGVKTKYMRRIQRLYKILNSEKSILFVRYISEEPRNADTAGKIKRFIEEIKKITKNFRILLICHSNKVEFTNIDNYYIIKKIIIQKDDEDIVSRNFFNDLNAFNEFQSVVKYNKVKRVNNYCRFYLKRFKSKIKGVFT